MGTAILLIVFLVMLASHHLLVSLAQVLLQQDKRTRVAVTLKSEDRGLF